MNKRNEFADWLFLSMREKKISLTDFAEMLNVDIRLVLKWVLAKKMPRENEKKLIEEMIAKL
jgi:DNA-binding transcriptional regulator YiaG